MDYLKKGDKIGVVSTARKISEQELIPAIMKLTEWGLEPVTGKNIFKEDNQYAGTDEERAADLQSFLDDSSIKGIICSRGGYGTIRIIDKLDFTEFVKNPKWIMGYSDITVLHSLLHTRYDIPSIHSSMAFNFPKDGSESRSVENLKEAMFGTLSGYINDPSEFNVKGKAEGILVGGNLSILYSLIGTPLDIDTRGKILFIEDLDEYLYHIDRIIMSLDLAGKLKDLREIIVGGMTDMKDNTIPFGKTAYEIISEIISKYGFPAIFNFEAGHIDPNLPLYLGKRIIMGVTGKHSIIKFI